jgi:hypothetical protein
MRLGVTAYGLWVNWEACMTGYPQVKPLFHVCGDASFVRLQPVCELRMSAFVRRIGIMSGSLVCIKLAQRFTFGHTHFESGTLLSEVRHTWRS